MRQPEVYSAQVADIPRFGSSYKLHCVKSGGEGEFVSDLEVAFLAGCELETAWREDGALVLRTRYPVTIVDGRVLEWRDERLR